MNGGELTSSSGQLDAFTAHFSLLFDGAVVVVATKTIPLVAIPTICPVFSTRLVYGYGYGDGYGDGEDDGAK